LAVGKITEKAIFRSETTWCYCTLSAELTKTHSFRLFFAHWVVAPATPRPFLKNRLLPFEREGNLVQNGI